MKRKINGFTLLELLIAIAIVAILSVAFLPVLRGSQSKARDVTKRKFLADIVTILEKMANDGENLLPSHAKVDNPPDQLNQELNRDWWFISYHGEPGGGQGDCLKFWTREVLPFATKLGRIQTFPRIGKDAAGDHLCMDGARTYVWYSKITSKTNHYILAIEVENAQYANVQDGVKARDIGKLTNVSTALSKTTDTVTVGDSGRFYYLIAKGGN